jgi:septal ring factor EnvC (AmiA/AmiB activator)
MRAVRWLLAVTLFVSGALAAAPGEWPGAGGRRELGRRGGELGEEAERLHDRLEELKRQDRDNHALTVARGRAYVRLARAGLMPLSQGLAAFEAHTSRLERLRRALARDLRQSRDLAARRIEVSKAIQELEEMKPAERDALARARTAVAAAEERDQAFERAFQSDWAPEPRTAVYGAPPAASPGGTPERGGFAGRRGRLPFPLAGRAEIQKVPSPSGEGKALLIAGALGSPVRAVFPGRVAFAADYPELGNTVILDHGDQYYTVSAHLERITVAVGEELDAGQRIGTLGSVDQKPGLLFEIRAGRSTVNTAEWFGI